MNKINKNLEEVHGIKKVKCSNKCKYYETAFEHNEKACVLSDVFSVKKGELCSTFERITHPITK